MVLGKLPVPGRPTILIRVGQGPTALATNNNSLLYLCISRMFTEFSSYACPVEQSQWKVCLFRNIPYNVG